MGMDVAVSTRVCHVFAGGKVEGVITVDVSDSDGSSAAEVMLSLTGKTHARVMHTVTTSTGSGSTTHRHAATRTKKFLKYEVALANFGGRAECGTHNFPYAILLPPNLPSSMKESSGDGSSCSIRYKLNARVHRPGMLKFDAKAEAEFTVFSRTQEASLAPVLVGPTTEKVTECCCVKKGSMSIGFQADKSVVGRLERLGLTVVARNDSTAPVKELRIEINQKAHWNAHGYKASKQRTVAKLIVSGSQLGPVGEGAAERPDRDRGFAAVGQDARAELQELLAAGAGVRHELVVPDNKCCDSLQTDMIRIRHSLDVKLKTSSWVTSPELSMPLTVQRTPPDAGALQVEAAGAGVSLPPMSYVESMPVVSAVLLDAPGNPTPSQIPSSAVKLQLESIKPSAPPQQDLPNHGSDSSDGDSSDSDSNSGSSNCR